MNDQELNSNPDARSACSDRGVDHIAVKVQVSIYAFLSLSPSDEPSIFASSHPGRPYNRFIHYTLNMLISLFVCCPTLDSQSLLNDQELDSNWIELQGLPARTADHTAVKVQVSIYLSISLGRPQTSLPSSLSVILVSGFLRKYGKYGISFHTFPGLEKYGK